MCQRLQLWTHDPLAGLRYLVGSPRLSPHRREHHRQPVMFPMLERPTATTTIISQNHAAIPMIHARWTPWPFLIPHWNPSTPSPIACHRTTTEILMQPLHQGSIGLMRRGRVQPQRVKTTGNHQIRPGMRNTTCRSSPDKTDLSCFGMDECECYAQVRPCEPHA